MHYGLIGYPIAQSLSPYIHHKLFALRKLNAHYAAYSEADFQRAIQLVDRHDLAGFNVTVPFKHTILSHPKLQILDSMALACEAVNTVKVKDGIWHGYNTDGMGFIRGLKYRQFDVHDKTVLMIGSGGAASGILAALISEGVAKVSIVNRTFENAQVLAQRFSAQPVPIKAIPIEQVHIYYDLIINTTPPFADLNSPATLNSVKPSSIFYEAFMAKIHFDFAVDLAYLPEYTYFMKLAQSKGKSVVGGLDMLFFQAAFAQDIWFESALEPKDLERCFLEVAQYVADSRRG